jgi:hypothetical protein
LGKKINCTSGAKARVSLPLGGTAEAVPFPTFFVPFPTFFVPFLNIPKPGL